MPDTKAIAIAYLDAFFAGEVEAAAVHLADQFEFEGPMSRYDSAAAFVAGSGPFLELIRPGWQLLSGFADEDETLFLYELELRAGGRLRVANRMVFAGESIAGEYIVFDTGRLAPEANRDQRA